MSPGACRILQKECIFGESDRGAAVLNKSSLAGDWTQWRAEVVCMRKFFFFMSLVLADLGGGYMGSIYLRAYTRTIFTLMLVGSFVPLIIKKILCCVPLFICSFLVFVHFVCYFWLSLNLVNQINILECPWIDMNQNRMRMPIECWIDLVFVFVRRV